MSSAPVEFLTGDLISMPPNQPPLVGKEEASRAWFEEGFKVAPSRLSESIQALQVFGDCAIERVTWALELQPTGGVPAKDNGKGLHIWRREGETWRVAQAIWNNDNPIPSTIWSGTTAATT